MKLVCFSFFGFRYSIKGEVSLLFVFRFSFFVIQLSNSGRISHYDIRNPILTFEFGPNIDFDIQNPILTFEFGPNIEF